MCLQLSIGWVPSFTGGNCRIGPRSWTRFCSRVAPRLVPRLALLGWLSFMRCGAGGCSVLTEDQCRYRWLWLSGGSPAICAVVPYLSPKGHCRLRVVDCLLVLLGGSLA